MVFADVVGSTALGERVDPETLRWAMQRWFGRMRDVVERHGGTVENYIGDAVMAVFGIPVAHEDDALRAVRAAAEMREEVAALRDELRRERGLDLAVRIGVNTGEAVTGAAAAAAPSRPATRSTSPRGWSRRRAPGDILLGRDTFGLCATRSTPSRSRRWRSRASARRSRPSGCLAVASDARGRLSARARRWSAASASGGGCSTPSIRRSPIARASCSPCSAPPASASRALCARCWRRSTARRPSPPAAACPTATG